MTPRRGGPQRALRPSDVRLEEDGRARDWVDALQLKIGRELVRHGGRGFWAVVITGPDTAETIMAGDPPEEVLSAAERCLKEDRAMAEEK